MIRKIYANITIKILIIERTADETPDAETQAHYITMSPQPIT
jgi:hypothetical protein